MKTIFPKIVQMNKDNMLESKVDREMLQRHAVTVMEGLGAAVESLDDSRYLNTVLISIGQTHVQRNVKPAMLKVWQVCLRNIRARIVTIQCENKTYFSKRTQILYIFTICICCQVLAGSIRDFEPIALAGPGGPGARPLPLMTADL